MFSCFVVFLSLFIICFVIFPVLMHAQYFCFLEIACVYFILFVLLFSCGNLTITQNTYKTDAIVPFISSYLYFFHNKIHQLHKNFQFWYIVPKGKKHMPPSICLFSPLSCPHFFILFPLPSSQSGVFFL